MPNEEPSPVESALPRLLTAAELADILKISVAAVGKRAQRGTLPPEVPNMRPRRWRETDIQAWLSGEDCA